jgi:hypothetical protein
MRIVNIIRDCVTPLQGSPTFDSGQKWLQNVMADKLALPAIFLDRPITGRLPYLGTARRERYSPVLLFADKSSPEYTQSQHDVIVEFQRKQAIQFLTNLQAHPEVERIETEPELLDVFNIFDANLTGVTLRFTLILKFEYPNYCPQPIIENIRELETGEYREIETEENRLLE